MNEDRTRERGDEDSGIRPDGEERPEPLHLVLFALAMLVLTLAIYQPAWQGEQLWDDDKHITAIGLRSVEGLGRIWFELGATQQYYPLLHTAFWLQHRIWGDETLGYHLVNIVLHALSALLVVLILKRLGIPGAFLAGTIFAVHPVHVESVAWITELKNTLSGTFYLAAALAYLRFDARRRQGDYLVALVLFVMALLSKTVTATLPAALLVVFWWQRARLSWHRDVLPLVPFFVVGVSGGLFTAWMERVYIGAAGAEFNYTLVERCLIAGRALWFYLGKLLWPANLAFNYPRWEISQEVWWQYLYLAGAVALLIVLWALRGRSRAPLAAMLLYCGTLFPVLGFFNVYPFRYSFVADHFQYLASLGIIALFSASVVTLLRRLRLRPGPPALAVLVVAAVVMGSRTWQQSRNYRDVVTLYTATLAENPDSWMAHNNLGVALDDRGRYQEAIAHFQQALQIKPDHAEAHNNLGGTLHVLGRHEEAIARFRQALRIKSDYAEAYSNLGATLFALRRHQEAVAPLRQALQIKPDHAEAYYNLGLVLHGLGLRQEAIAQFHQALQIRPDYVDAHYNLGVALHGLGRFPEAIQSYRQALSIKPDHAKSQNNLGVALHHLGRFPEAIQSYQKAVSIAPNFAEALNNLGAALRAVGRHEEAVLQFRAALRIRPDYAEANNNLGTTLQVLGRYREAIPHHEDAVRVKPDFADAHYRWGNALQLVGRYAEAVARYRDSLKIEPRNANAHHNLSAALQAVGRIEEARAHYRESLRIKQGNAAAAPGPPE